MKAGGHAKDLFGDGKGVPTSWVHDQMGTSRQQVRSSQGWEWSAWGSWKQGNGYTQGPGSQQQRSDTLLRRFWLIFQFQEEGGCGRKVGINLWLDLKVQSVQQFWCRLALDASQGIEKSAFLIPTPGVKHWLPGGHSRAFSTLFSFDLAITIVTLDILDRACSLLKIHGNRKAELEMIHVAKICRTEVNCWLSQHRLVQIT